MEYQYGRYDIAAAARAPDGSVITVRPCQWEAFLFIEDSTSLGRFAKELYIRCTPQELVLKEALTKVGFFKNWSTTNLTECQTSSRWSECIVNAYHLCGHAVANAGGGGLPVHRLNV